MSLGLLDTVRARDGCERSGEALRPGSIFSTFRLGRHTYLQSVTCGTSSTVWLRMTSDDARRRLCPRHSSLECWKNACARKKLPRCWGSRNAPQSGSWAHGNWSPLSSTADCGERPLPGCGRISQRSSPAGLRKRPLKRSAVDVDSNLCAAMSSPRLGFGNHPTAPRTGNKLRLRSAARPGAAGLTRCGQAAGATECNGMRVFGVRSFLLHSISKSAHQAPPSQRISEASSMAALRGQRKYACWIASS
jgi:hypothetical protein